MKNYFKQWFAKTSEQASSNATSAASEFMRRRQQLAEWQQKWELLSRKLTILQKEHILETRPDEKLRLEEKIAEADAERQRVWQRLRELEAQGNDDEEESEDDTDIEQPPPEPAGRESGSTAPRPRKAVKQTPADFLPQYVTYLQGVHAYLKFKGLSHGHIPNIALNRVYIALKAVAGEGEPPEQHVDLYKTGQQLEQAQRTQEAARTQFLETNFYQAEEQIQHKFAVERLLGDYPRLVIVGEPGSGKTTLVEYLLLELLAQPAAYQQVFGFAQPPVPLFLQLRTLQPQALPNLETLAQVCLPDMLQSACPDGFFRQVIVSGGAVLFFDGLDEITRPDERRQVARWIDELCAAFPNNRYIVTARPLGYREAPLHNGFHKFGLCAFDREDIRQFVLQWQAAVDIPRPGETDADRQQRISKDVERLLDIMKAKPGIRHLASNPLLLTIVLLVYNSRTRLPEERGRLYDECIDVLLEHIQKARLDEAKDGAFKPTQGLKLEQQRDLLKSLAFWLHEQGLREGAELEIRDHVLAKLFPAIGLDASETGRFLKEVEERSGLLIHRGAGLGFAHLTFQEYLTALELCDREDSQETIAYLAARRLRSWWHEVIQLYAGSVVDAGRLIRGLLAEADTPLHHALLLAGQCLADARKVKDVALRQNVIQQLADLYQTTPFRYIRLQARQVLVRIGTPEVARVFIEILENALHPPMPGSIPDDILRIRDAVEVLARLHTGADVKAPLLKLLKTADLPAEVTQIALRGLQNVMQADDELLNLFFAFTTADHTLRTRQEAVTTLSCFPFEPAVSERIRREILEHAQYADKLDEVYVAAAKGFLKYLPGEDALRLLTAKMLIPNMAEYKVELCRALTMLNVPLDALTAALLELLQRGIDWGARGGAALALGLLKHDRERTAHVLADALTQERDLGVRLRLADALGHLGWRDKQIDQILKHALNAERHFQTRWKLTEAYALLTRQEDFIQEHLIAPILRTETPPEPDRTDRQDVGAPGAGGEKSVGSAGDSV